MDVGTSEAALLEAIAAAGRRRDVESLCAVLRANITSPALTQCCDALLELIRQDVNACASAVACGAVNSVVQAIRELVEAPSSLLFKLVLIINRLTACPGAPAIIRKASPSGPLCALLRNHINDARLVAACCVTLAQMMEHGDVMPAEVAELAEVAVRIHPADASRQSYAKHLMNSLASSAALPGMTMSPERAALARVAGLKASRDFATIMNDMDAFPELEELQRAGCLAMYVILGGGSHQEAVTAGAVECVVRALDLFHHSAETQLITLKALNRLIAPQLEASVVVAAGEAGAVRLAVRALRSFPENARVIEYAFYVLGKVTSLPQVCEEALSVGALVLCVAALRRCSKHYGVQAGACGCLAHLCGFDDAVAFDALSMGAMELALAALRSHRSHVYVCSNACALMCDLCLDEVNAFKAKQLGAPALLEAALKAHPSVEIVSYAAAAALDPIQELVDDASARADANMAELIAGEEAAKGGKGGAAPSNARKGKAKAKGGEAAAAGPFPPPPLPPRHPLPPRRPSPPVAADGVHALTKAQIKRRKVKAGTAARKVAAAISSVTGEEEEEEGSDASSGDSEPLPRSRPPLDFSKDSEFRRSLKLPPRDVEAEIGEIIAQHEALLNLRREAPPDAALTVPPGSSCTAQGVTNGVLPALTTTEPVFTSSPSTDEEAAAPLQLAALQPSSAAVEPDASPLLSRADNAAISSRSASSPQTLLDAALVEIAALKSEVAGLKAANAGLHAELASLRTRVAAQNSDSALLRERLP